MYFDHIYPQTPPTPQCAPPNSCLSPPNNLLSQVSAPCMQMDVEPSMKAWESYP